MALCIACLCQSVSLSCSTVVLYLYSSGGHEQTLLQWLTAGALSQLCVHVCVCVCDLMNIWYPELLTAQPGQAALLELLDYVCLIERPSMDVVMSGQLCQC